MDFGARVIVSALHCSTTGLIKWAPHLVALMNESSDFGTELYMRFLLKDR